MAKQSLARNDYLEKVYAGVLGKMIGVYLGRPVEGWSFARISAELGEIDTYVHDRVGVPLVVTDDDLSGTFTFVRALEDFGDREVTSAEIGETWLNYLIENKTVLWWGGRGTSTEHTAYLNLASGIAAPVSGSARVNGTATANQIGAMIFVDGWAMLCPGDPARAARMAREAAQVSHDQDAVDAAVAIAVMEALAFVEPDLEVLLTAAESFLSSECAIVRQIEALRALHRREPDWRLARAWIETNHGYHKYPGTCHVVPNFSLIVLALLYGEGDFRRSLSIVTTSGWDTDCNAANLGCLLAIRNGLAALEACPDLRLPPRDQIYLVTADGGRAITDAAREAVSLANQHFRLAGEPEFRPHSGARFAFPFAGSLQGFHSTSAPLAPAVQLTCVSGTETPVLRLDFGSSRPASVATPVFIPPHSRQQSTYEFLASPTLYPGQLVTAQVSNAGAGSTDVSLYVLVTDPGDNEVRSRGPVTSLGPGETKVLCWMVAPADSPLLEVGLELYGGELNHTVLLHWLTWSGVPNVTLGRGSAGATEWKRAWVPAVDHWWTQFPDAFHLSQNRGTGLLIQGLREWGDYEVTASVAGSGAKSFGLAARVQGLRRYYALLLLPGGQVRLVRELHGTNVLAEQDFSVVENHSYQLRLQVTGTRLVAFVDQTRVFDVDDRDSPLLSGALALVVEEGTLRSNEVVLRALEPTQGGPPSYKLA